LRRHLLFGWVVRVDEVCHVMRLVRWLAASIAPWLRWRLWLRFCQVLPNGAIRDGRGLRRMGC
jgi:hypothetical protein